MKRKYKKKFMTIIIVMIFFIGLFLSWGKLSEIFGGKDNTMNPPDGVTYQFDTSVLDRSLVRLTNTTPSYTNNGSGVVIHQSDTETFIITNAHIFDEVGQIEIMNGTLQLTAQIVPLSSDSNMDLVLLKVPRNEYLTPVQVSTIYQVSNLVVAIGYPNGEYDVQPGLITSITTRINSSARISGGSSGSGLFNAQMQLIGINKGMVVDVNGAWLSTVSIKSTDIINYMLGLGYYVAS